MSCAAESSAAAAPLAGSATQARRWLVVEHRGQWGRDVVADTVFSAPVAERLVGFDGRVLLVRRPRRASPSVTVFYADTTETGGELRRLALASLDDLATADLEAGEVVAGPLVLVCAHGRRDACCARLGPPAYDALREHGEEGSIWQSSHHGGHRFAANVLVLPWGVQLGRVDPATAAVVMETLAERRIPLDLYRGRTLYEPHVQAAEIAARRRYELDHVDALRLVSDERGQVRFAGPSGDIEAVVTEREGPTVPASCGAEPSPTTTFAVSLESSA
jgi:hypothetical protein